MQDRYRSVYILVVSIYLCEECDEATKAKACSAQCSGLHSWSGLLLGRRSETDGSRMEDGREKEEDFGGFLHQKARLWARCLANFNSPAAESLPWHAPPTPRPSSNQQGGLCFARIESASGLTVPVLSYSYSTYPVRPSLLCY